MKYQFIFRTDMKSKRKKSRKSDQLIKIEFKILQKVFAKQRGWVHWPAVTIDFHPTKFRTAKVEYFGWNHQWYRNLCIFSLYDVKIHCVLLLDFCRAWVSFENLMEIEAAESIIQKNIHKSKFARACNEMNIWQPTILRPVEIINIENKCNRITRSKSKSLNTACCSTPNLSNNFELMNTLTIDDSDTPTLKSKFKASNSNAEVDQIRHTLKTTNSRALRMKSNSNAVCSGTSTIVSNTRQIQESAGDLNICVTRSKSKVFSRSKVSIETNVEHPSNRSGVRKKKLSFKKNASSSNLDEKPMRTLRPRKF